MAYFPTYVKDPLVNQNHFLGKPADDSPLLDFSAARGLLPVPFWEGHPDEIACYWKTWEIAFRNILKPTADNGFVSNYIDTAFNGCLFMWDSAFILMFGKYGRRAFNFQATVDNFYAKQHPDGFICREINEKDGLDRFHRFDPASTGPNVLPWSEWEYYLTTGNQARLEAVFAPLLAYYRWFRSYRTWRDGTYWSSGLGCGMDNMPRMDETKYDHGLSPARMVWLDTCLQEVLSAQILRRIAAILGRETETGDLDEEIKFLSGYINARLWDPSRQFYFDLDEQDRWSAAYSVGAYWALLAEVVPGERLPGFLAHLNEPGQFKRPHRVPSLAADHPGYHADGGYWRGGVWPPTNYMLLRGLSMYHQDDLAAEIAANHLEMVVEVYRRTGTVWENYAPESPAPGTPAKPDFVGWGGLPPVAVLLEYVFGLRPYAEQSRLVWDVRQLEAHGVTSYPFAQEGVLNLRCAARSAAGQPPHIQASSNVELTLELRWENGRREIHLAAGGSFQEG